MSTITLQEYLNRIEQLIEENRFSDAVNHCRFILEAYPRHIDTYRLLAKALLEQHDYDGATDLFQRVLSADPNDMIAHVGLSIIRGEEAQMDDSLWHLERAFEIDPYNATIQEELRRHYAQYSDTAVDRIPLTSGALARLYLKGELYQQAVQELRKALEENSDRVDLEVLLAEALWRNDQRIDAEEACLNVLQKLPNCIVANAILSEIWLQTGRIGESQKYLRRLQDLTSLDKQRLDLSTPVGRAFNTEGAPPLPDQIELEFKDEPELAGAAQSAKGPSADWMNELTFEPPTAVAEEPAIVEEPISESPSNMHNYDWLADLNEDVADDDEPMAQDSWFKDDTATDEDDWLAELTAVPDSSTHKNADDLLFADDDDETLPDALFTSEASWFTDKVEAADTANEDTSQADESGVPDWLSDLTAEPADDLAAASLTAVANADWFDDADDSPADAVASDVPDWLQGFNDEPATPAEPAQIAHALNDEWAIDNKAEDAWDAGEYAADDIPDWLQGVTDDDDDGDAPLAVGTNMADADDTPEWLLNQTGLLAVSPDEASEDWFAAEDDFFDAEPDDTAVDDSPEPASPGSFTSWLSEAANDDLPADQPATADSDDDWLLSDGTDLFGTDLQPDDTAVDHSPEPANAGSFTSWLSEAANDDLPADQPATADNDDDWLLSDGTDLFGTDLQPGDTAVDHSPEPSSAGSFTSWLSEAANDDLPADSSDAAEESTDLDDLWADLDAQPATDDSSWLTGLTSHTDAPEPASQSSHLESDWLNSDALQSGDWADGDWLEGFAETTPESEQASGGLFHTESENDHLDWLSADDQSQFEQAEAVVIGDKDEDEKSLPEIPETGDDAQFSDLEDDGDWLSALGGGLDDILSGDDEDELLFDDSLEVTPSGDSVTDWLSDYGDDTAVDANNEGASWLSEISTDTGQFDPDSDLADILSDSAPLSMTDWLTADSTDDILSDDWLDAEAEDEAPVQEEAPTATGLASWIDRLPANSAETDADLSIDIPSEELFATDAENLPDWLSAEGPTAVDELEGANLPDWLVEGSGQAATDDFLETDDSLALTSESSDFADAFDNSDTAALTALLSSLGDDATVDGVDSEIAWLMEDDGNDMIAADDDLGGLDWLTEPTDEPETAVDEPALQEATAVDVGQDRSPEELNDAISWLEELATQQETPVEELPTVANHLLALDNVPEDEDAVLDDVVAEFMDTAVADDLGWEEPTAVEEADENWLDVLMADDEDKLEAPPEDQEEALAWLEGLAARQGAPLEELPSQQQPDLVEEDDFVDEAQSELDDALAWMGNLATSAEEEWPEMIDDDALAAAFSAKDAGMAVDLPSATDAADQELAAALDQLENMAKADGITPVEITGLAKVSDHELNAALQWVEASIQPAETAVETDDDLAWLPNENAADASDLDLDFAALLAEDEPDDEPLFIPKSDPGDDAADDVLVNLVTSGLAAPTLDLDDGAMPEDPDAAMEWLLKVGQAPFEAEDELTAVADSDDFAFSDDPDDPDDAMAWLLSMTGDDGEIEFDMQPPPITPSEDAAFAVSYSDTAVSQPDTAELEAETEPETAVDDLADLASLDADDDLDLDDESWLEDMLLGDGDIEFDMQPPPITPSEDAAFAVSYSDKPVTPSQPDLAELEAETEPDTAVDDLADLTNLDADADLDLDDESWLEDMLLGDGDIEFDMQPPPITPSEDAAFAVSYSDTAVSEPDLAELEAETEPDTAVDDLADLTNLDADDDLDLDDESWLEDMLLGDGDIEFDMQPPPITPSEDAAFAVSYSDTAVTSQPDTAVDDLADLTSLDAADDLDLDDESWLEDMLLGDGDIEFDMQPPPITPSEDAAFAVSYSDKPAAPSEPELLEEDLIAAMPEDPDETVAWFEKMAAEQSADLEDQAAIGIAPDESALPSWMQVGADDSGLTADYALADDADDLGAESLDFMGDLGVDIEDDLTDSLPDWFSIDEQQSASGQTGWLRSLEDIDVGSWLASEAEASIADFDDDLLLVDSGDLRPSTPSAVENLASLATAVPDLPSESYEVVATGDDTAVDANQLSDARIALAQKKYDEAVNHYQQLIASGTSTLGLIAELESLADENPQQASFRRLLGDAYMRNGQLQKALNTYRLALDQL